MDGFEPGSVWPSTSASDQQTREVYARYGLAMYMAQVLEHGVVNALVIFDKYPSRDSYYDAAEWERTIDNAYAAEFELSFGNLIQRLRRQGHLPINLIERLEAAKIDRNILAHSFFRKNDENFIRESGRRYMIRWCEDRVKCFQALSQDIDVFLEPTLERSGLSRAEIDARVEEFLSSRD